MTSDELVAIVRQNPVNADLLERLPHAGLHDVWLVSGCLFQTVWNVHTGREVSFGIRDFDIFYFDGSDLNWEAEDRAIKRAQSTLGLGGHEIEIRNQARVHLWYEQKFGLPYPQLRAGHEGIDRFLATACMIGLQPTADGAPLVYAPAGLDDLANMVIRPNPTSNFNADNYWQKSNRWKQYWPELTVLAPD
ncbi:MAG: nucleotidyltransferase family protein [Devosiaceae bacterium]|nr:nucleotidyltransferase family protein [Devosiaceae bacterium MH13]